MKLWTPRRYQKILAILVLVAVLCISVFVLDSLLTPSGRLYTLHDGWKIEMNGEVLDATDFNQANVGVINQGDTISLSRTLEDFEIPNPGLSIHTVHAVLEAYLDGELIYSYGKDLFENNKSVPKHLNYIPLGNDYPGKEIKLVLIGSRMHSFSGMSAIVVAERATLFSGQLAHMHRNIVLGAFLIVLSILLMILSPYMVLYHNNDFRLFFSGMISLFLGLYVYSYYGIVDLICGNDLLNMVCEYSSLYNIPTAIMGYLMSVYKGRLKIMFRVFFLTNLVTFTSVFVICVFFTGRINSFTPILHLLAGSEAVISIIVLIWTFFDTYKDKEKHLITSDNLFSLGLLVFMILSLGDVVKYNLQKYFNTGHGSYATINGYLFGSIVFVSGLLVSYMLYIIYNANLDTLQSKISSLAYTDPLTGLANRARCEQIMEMLSEEHGTYVIISMDLNKLKEVNDSLGHHEGDRLLSGFATILSDSFLDASLVGRMGGDEFIVILTDDRALSCTRRIHNFYSAINNWNRKETRFQYSASYGYAYSHEVPSGSAQEVYMLADNRMYEMKREHQTRNAKGVIQNA
jgi:diguanylate cyclase (GGDEF)-like protein